MNRDLNCENCDLLSACLNPWLCVSFFLIGKKIEWKPFKFLVKLYYLYSFTRNKKRKATFSVFWIRLILWDYSSQLAGSDQQWSSWYRRRGLELELECCLKINLISCNQSTGTADISSQRITLEQTFILPASKNKADWPQGPVRRMAGYLKC